MKAPKMTRAWTGALLLALPCFAAGEWVNLGPGGLVTAFVADPRNAGTIYAATTGQSGPPGSAADQSTIFKSTDGGVHWDPMTTVRGLTSALIVNPANPAEICTLQGSPGFIDRSTDGGQTWTALPLPPPAMADSIAVSPDGVVLYVGGSFPAVILGITCVLSSYPVVYRSENGGVSWIAEPVESPTCLPLATNRFPPSHPIEKLASDGFDRTVVYGIVDGSVFRRSASSWEEVLPIPTGDCKVSSLVASHGLPAHVRVGRYPLVFPSPCSLLLDSSDAGDTFVAAPSPIPLDSDARIEALALDPSDPNVWYVSALVFSSSSGPTGEFIFATSDGGRFWRSLGWPGSLPVHGLAVDADGRTLYAVSDSGIFAREVRPARGAPRTVPFRR